jgi:hypothetical protein
MQLTTYDPAQVILFSLHVGGALSDPDVDRVVAGMERARADATRHGVGVTNLVLIESQHSATAVQRRRMADAMKVIPRGQTAFVVRSPLIRGMITAMSWLSMSDAGRNRVQSTHATYEGARQWLVEQSGHPASRFDAMERELRSSVQRMERTSGTVG